MKAAYIQEHGGPEKILYGDQPDPAVKPGQVLIKVRACALNHIDIWVRSGSPAYKVPLPHIMGADVAGEAGGRRVVVMPGLSCGACVQCAAGRDNQCESFKILGTASHGGYAEFAAVPERNVFPMPKNLSFEEAASFPLTFLTAWHMLMTRAQLQKGETVVVLGAGSGVGAAAIQIAKLAGARVIAVSSSDDKLAKARELGADFTVNGGTDDFAEKAREWTGGRGADVVFEHVGPATWEKSVKALAPYGRIVTCGATTGPSVTLELRFLFSRNLSILGSRLGTLAEFKQILAHVESGRLKPVVSKIFPLSEARAAHDYLEKRNQMGKIVLKVA